MAKPRIILADTNMDYIVPIRQKFVEEFFEKIELEIITDKAYFDHLFDTPQRAAVLVVSEELYSSNLQRHNIDKIFVMTEEKEEEGTDELLIEKVFKYSSINAVFNEIVSKSDSALNIENSGKKQTQIIVVTSASGGTGKTTVAMGLAACISQNYKKALYINCGQLQCFGHLLKNPAIISNNQIYSRISRAKISAYTELRHMVRRELFYYLPPFKASLISLGIAMDVFKEIAEEAKRNAEYDFIILDTDGCFDDSKVELMTIADKVVIVTKQNRSAVLATNALVSNINGFSKEKYIFLCNDFDSQSVNALNSPAIELKFSINEYIEHIAEYDTLSATDFANGIGLKKAAFLLE